MRDAVENLALAYIDIRREGCIQFDDLLVVVHCNSDRGTGVEIRLQSINKKFFGNTQEMSAIDHCMLIYGYINSCVEKWRRSMDEQRK